MLSLIDASLYVGGKLLISEANLTIGSGKKMGVVGRNGCGKSHLMQLLAGQLSPDSGSRKVASNTTVLLVKQELPDDEQSPLDYLRNNDPDLLALDLQIETADTDDFGDLCTQKMILEEDRYEVLAPKVLMGLGLTKEELENPMRNLSGGLRMRINLAMALVRTPDVLLLDEPTNHLDLESTQWLIAFLKNYALNASFIIVTHDVKLLMEVCNTTVHLRAGTLTQFEGDYALYRELLKIELEKNIQSNNDLEKQIERKMEIYYKFRDLPENRAAQAVAQHKRAEKLKESLVEIIKEDPIVKIVFKEPSELQNPIIHLENVCIGYNSAKTVLNNLNLSIQYGTKIGLLGQNGEGKSTLVKCLVGKLLPLSGEMESRPRLKIGYFSQDLTDELDGSLSVYQQFVKATGIEKDAEIRSTLGHYGFSYDKTSTLVGNLSGGEKSRLTFAFICIASPNLIILDEPTNHLDVETREELVNAIHNFKGSVVLVSHDWDFHEKTMDTFWLAKNGSVQVYNQGLQHYQSTLQRFIEKNLQTSQPDFEPKKLVSKEASKESQSTKMPVVNNNSKKQGANNGKKSRQGFFNAANSTQNNNSATTTTTTTPAPRPTTTTTTTTTRTKKQGTSYTRK